MSSPAGSTGTGTGDTANVYAPQYQPQADQSLWQTLAPLLGASANAGAGTPGGVAYPQAQNEVSNFLTGSPYATQALTGAQTGASLGLPGAQAISTGAGDVLNTGFDPQSALFNRTQQEVTDQSNAANAMAGVGQTPYGASVTSNALGNFDINWQQQQQQQQAAALGAATGAYPAATSLAASSAALPYSTGANIASNALQGLGSQVNLGNSQYALPQQAIADLQSYMGTGQQASQISGQLGALGLQEEQNSLSGIGSLFGSLFGSSVGQGFQGIGSLFAGGGGQDYSGGGF